MMVWLWGVNLLVFAQSSVSYAKIFDLDLNHLTHREIWKVRCPQLLDKACFLCYVFIFDNALVFIWSLFCLVSLQLG